MPLEIPAPSDRDTIDHARRWRAHVEAGRIGTGTPSTTEIALQHLHNEEVLWGRARTFAYPAPRRSRFR